MMKKVKDLGPVICMEHDQQALDFILSNVLSGEPCSLIGMKDLSKNLIYSTLLEQLKTERIPYHLKEVHATSEEELQTFVDDIKMEESPLLCVANLSIGKDVSWFIKILDEMRDKCSTAFVSVVISDFGEVLEALDEKQKILVRSMFVSLPADFEDSLRLMRNFEDRFDFKLTKIQEEELYRLSGGQAGLLKSLFLLLKEDLTVKLDVKELLEKDSILSRIQALVTDLGTDLVEFLVNPSDDLESRIVLERFGFIKEGKIFSPLLEWYLKRLPKDIDKVITPFLTKQEKLVFDFLNKYQNALVSREGVAQAMWGNEWENSYSDWAIDKLISRLGSKISEKIPDLKLQTKKGMGFILSSL